MNVERKSIVQYVFTGFTHDSGFRVFAFDCIGTDVARTRCHVRVDLALVRRYGIRVQELPLLCRGMLESSTAGEPHALTYTEAEMRQQAELCATRAAEARKHKAPRRPPTENVGLAWRGAPGTVR